MHKCDKTYIHIILHQIKIENMPQFVLFIKNETHNKFISNKS